MSMVSRVKSLSDGVGTLTTKINDLYKAIQKVSTASDKALKNANSVVNTVGGGYGLTQATNRPGTGADGARFSVGTSGQTQNVMSGSLSGFGMAYGYGSGRFPYPAYPSMMGMSESTMGKMSVASAALSFGTGIASGAYQMMPGLAPTMNRTLGYYQAALRSPGISRNQLERATFSALGGGVSAVGSDANVANILASMGYGPGSQNYLGAAAQVGGAYKYLGMSNEAAAQAIGGMQTGSMQANLFQYGITTYDAGTGREKSTGQIARELMNYMGGGKATVKQVQESFKQGALGANLQTMGFSSDQQNMLYQAMIDIASGRNPDLATAAPVKGNENTFLTAQGRLNASTTDVMMTAEEKMIKGFENAADTVEFFNRQVKHAADALGYIVGYTQGVSGTPAGQGGGKILKNIVGGIMAVGGVMLAPATGGASLALTAGGVNMLGGGTTGYGSTFGVAKRGKTGGGASVSGAAITAGFGAKDTTAGSPWSGTNGTHTGVDYDMPIGTPVTSAYNGFVSAVNINADYGTSVMINNDDGTQAIYAHLSEKAVKVGETVRAGQRIGKSGKSGNAMSPHLHFELRDAKNHPIDPSSAGSGGMFGSYLTSNPSLSQITGSTSGVTKSITSSGGGKGSLSDSALTDILVAAGFKGSALTTALAVARAESGGRPGALNPDASTGDYSMGLFQINMIGKLGRDRNEAYLRDYASIGYTGPESLYDPAINARIAYDISKGGNTWSKAWVNTSKKLGIGGATTGYGAAVPSATLSSGDRTVNVTLKIERATEEEAMQFAKRVKYYLDSENEITMIGKA